MKTSLHIYFWTLALFFFVGSAQAVVAPYYAYGEISALDGSLGVIEQDNLENTAALSVAGGAQWWCDIPGPSCGVSVSSGATSAWGEVSVDPVTGTLGARAGSLRYDNNGGYGYAYGYISQVFKVGTDGTLQTGDSVNVDVNMLLQGIIESQSNFGNASSMITLNHYDPLKVYTDYLGNPLDYMPLSTFQDLYFTPELLDPMLGVVQHSAHVSDGTVNFMGSDSAEVRVGDVLIMESMISVDNHLAYSANLGYSWTDFQHTMNATLTTTTAGAVINAVPVPATVWLFGSGLIGLIGFARRKNSG